MKSRSYWSRSLCFKACLCILCSLLCLPAVAGSQASLSQVHQSANKGSQWPIQNSIRSTGIAADDYIVVDGFHLRDGQGEVHFLRGMNYWSCMNLAAEDSAGGNLTRLQLELDQLSAAGINHLRIMAATQGSGLETRQPYRILPALQSGPLQWDERVFAGLDRCIAEAGKRGMRVTMVMGNTWQWTGGNAQLRAWTTNETIPYPRSWEITAPPQRTDGLPGWGNWSVGDERFTRFQGMFYHDCAAGHLYRAHLDSVMNRMNSITGRRYSQDATIMAWEPINEPTAASSDHEDFDALIRWYRATARHIKAAAPKQLVTTGYESKQSEQEFNAIHGIKEIDYACAHMWPQIWGKYKMLNSTRENLDEAIRWSREYILQVQNYARQLGKPIFLEEVGMPRDNWVNGKKQYLYDTSASTTSRDALFAAIFDLIAEEHKQGQALVGVALWSYGGVYRSSTQQYNNQGMIMAGDPPQEPPGWHSILDTDHTLSLIARLQASTDVEG